MSFIFIFVTGEGKEAISVTKVTGINLHMVSKLLAYMLRASNQPG